MEIEELREWLPQIDHEELTSSERAYLIYRLYGNATIREAAELAGIGEECARQLEGEDRYWQACDEEIEIMRMAVRRRVLIDLIWQASKIAEAYAAVMEGDNIAMKLRAADKLMDLIRLDGDSTIRDRGGIRRIQEELVKRYEADEDLEDRTRYLERVTVRG